MEIYQISKQGLGFTILYSISEQYNINRKMPTNVNYLVGGRH